jgi:hypothetical protein
MTAAVVGLALIAAQDRTKRQPSGQPTAMAAVTTAAPTAAAMETTAMAAATATIAAPATIAATTVPATAVATPAVAAATVAAAPILGKHGCRRKSGANQGKRSYRGR